MCKIMVMWVVTTIIHPGEIMNRRHDKGFK